MGDREDTAEAEETLALAEANKGNRAVNTRCTAVFKRLDSAMRDIKRRYFFSPPMNEWDFVDLGVPLHDDVPTTVNDPISMATADLTFPAPGLVELVKIRIMGEMAGDPRAAHGVRVHYGVTDSVDIKHRIAAAPQSGEELPHSFFIRRKKHLFDFTADRGKKFYVAFRYENAKGGTGPFSPVMDATIP